MGRLLCLAVVWTLVCGLASAEADEPRDGELPRPQEIPEDDQQLIAAFEDQLRAMDPDDPERPTTMFLRAKSLWRYQHYNVAIELLEQIVKQHLDSEAGEYAVDLLLDSLIRMRRYDDLVARVNALLEKRAFLADHEELAERLRMIQQQSRRKDAERAEAAGDYEGCGEIYLAIFAADPKADHLDEVLYNAAYCFQSAGDLGHAIALRERIVTVFPKSRLAMRSWVLLANDHARMADYRKAAERFEGYAKRYGGEKDARHALMNAVVYRRALGDVDQAVKNIERFVKQYGRKRKDEAAAAMFSLAGLYRGRDDAKLGASLRRYLKLYGARGGKDRAIIATVELGRIAWEASCRKPDRGLCRRKRRGKRVKEAQQWFREALVLDRKLRRSERAELPSPRLESLRDALGAARFYLADAKLEAVLGDANLPVDEVEQAYREVVETKSSRWAVAALARRGQLLEARGDADAATEQFVACLATASDATVDSEWAQLCDERVAEARPDAASPAERRAAPTVMAPVLSRPPLQR